MSINRTLFCLVSILALALSAMAQEPSDQEEGVRGSFLVSRPASKKASAKPAAKGKGTSATPKPRTRPASAGGEAGGSVAKAGKPKPAPEVKRPGVPSKGPIGLGYSIFLRDARGDAIRVDPSRFFHANDSVRLSLESNIDGYLYVFYTENDGPPQMLFPDARLANGDNSIEAHVPYEVPSSLESNPAHRWFVFDNKPAIEKLYIVVARERIQGVPVGSALVEHCKGIEGSGCLWSPDERTWTEIAAGLNRKVNVSKSANFGQAQSEDEAVATLRRLGLDDEAPEPSVVRMSASADAPALLTLIELIHR